MNGAFRNIACLIMVLFLWNVPISLGESEQKDEFLIDETGAVPKLYYCLRDYRELTDDAFAIIMKVAQDQGLLTSDAWFLEVHADSMGKPTHYVKLYFKPLSVSSTVRRGEAAEFIIDGDDSSASVRYSRRFRYVQLASSNGMGMNDPRVPTPRYLPFEETTGLSDDDIVAVAECGRNRALGELSPERLANEPMGMSVRPDGSVRVYVGHGGGVIITCRRQGNGFTADEDVSHFFAP